MPSRSRQISLFEGVDRVAVLLYVLLVGIGLVNILSASYNDEIEMFSFAQQYVKQLMWMGLCFGIGLVILLLESKYYHMLAYYAYAFCIVLMLATLVPGLGREVNGARAWLVFGLQPIELMKVATALSVARLMSNYTFSIRSVGGLLRVGALMIVPIGLTLLQNDTGSGLVLCSFIFVLYREGLNKWLCIPAIIVAVLFVCSLLFTQLLLLLLLLFVFTLSDAMMVGRWRMHLRFMTLVCLGAVVLYGLSAIFLGGALSGTMSLIIALAIGTVVAAVYAWRMQLSSMFLILAMFVGSMLFVPAADYVFENVLQGYHRKRIISFLGIERDATFDWNVDQAKIAIGSGGLFGKGFMEGTQVRYGFVPEQDTDFIFCTVGEEWGFVGTMTLLALLCALILRLMKMGERQEEPFCRIYSYCVASILLFHVLVNVGMTVGLIPVMGIPLPFISYGGSSLLGFTLLLFIAIRLDASPTRI